MVKILANDGMAQKGIDLLEKEGFEVKTTHVAHEQLANYINKNKITGLLVRSATKVDKKIIDECPDLKLIGRGGVGMDNIDVAHAESKGIIVFNTPEASSESVAELVFAHLLNGVRFLHDANRHMPLEGDSQFKQLKKSYAAGVELRGKTLGVLAELVRPRHAWPWPLAWRCFLRTIPPRKLPYPFLFLMEGPLISNCKAKM